MMSRSQQLLLIPLVGALIALLVVLSGCGSDKGPDGGDDRSPSASAHDPWHANPDATYVGAKACIECHQPEFEDWKKSDHHKAMEPANETTVLGDFNDTTFEHFGRDLSLLSQRETNSGSTPRTRTANARIGRSNTPSASNLSSST